MSNFKFRNGSGGMKVLSTEDALSKTSNNYIKVKFLIYLLYIFKTSAGNNAKISFFIKPRKRSLISVLNPPYRNKSSQVQLTQSRFFLHVSVKIFNKNSCLTINQPQSLIAINKDLRVKLCFLETNLVFLKKIKIYLPFIFKENFLRFFNI